MKIGDIVHVIGFTSPASTGVIIDKELSISFEVDYTVDFMDGEVTAFKQQELREATAEEVAVFNSTYRTSIKCGGRHDTV